jgi:MFS family permease
MSSNDRTPPTVPPPAQNAGQSRIALMLRSLRHRNFRLFFAGQLISLVGTWMDIIAESWLVYRLTGSSLLLGTMAFASQIPVFLLAPIGGTVADRYNRHRLIIATQSCAMVLAGILAWLTLSHRIERHIDYLFILASLLGVVNAFDIPARQAFLMDMVGRDDLMNAIALNSSMFNGARIVGPAVAGILVAKIGEGWCFAANSISFIAVIAGLVAMHVPKPKLLQSHKSAIENIVEGFRFARRSVPIRSLLMLIGLVSLVGMPYSVLMPIFAAQILHGNARTLGILMGATGVGALIGALTLAAKRGMKGLSKWVAITSTTFGLGLIAFSFSRSIILSVILLVPVGLSMMVQMASTNTLLQAMVPDQLRGRVIALYSMMFMGMAPFGGFFAGAIAQKIGAPWTLAMGGMACVAGSALFFSRLPAIRAEARELILAQGMAGGEPAAEMNVGGMAQNAE